MHELRRAAPPYRCHPRSKLNPVTILERCHVQELSELKTLRGRGWADEGLDDRFWLQRHRADHPPIEAQYAWYHGMVDILQEIDAAAGFIPKSGPFRFLDLGCAPGGFSAHILKTNPDARGVGISLPESQGGHALLLDEAYLPRYEYLEHDLLEYDLLPLACHSARGRRGSLLSTSLLHHHDLVMLDGSALRTYHAPSSIELNGSAPATTCRVSYGFTLLLAQLIIALSSIKPGGTIVMRLARIESYPAAHLVYLLDALSNTLVVHKPRRMHAPRASFYVVAKGVADTEERAAFMAWSLQGLKELWHELRCGGPGQNAIPAERRYDALDFIVETEHILDMNGYLPRLIELGRPVWGAQAEALRRFFMRKGLQDVPTVVLE
ncbi:hypothetical protein BD414DRAFT_424300 [Trametes punicea]|nr:hypothetical protein BD414DRAFT_424300 [Trametes punicea]